MITQLILHSESIKYKLLPINAPPISKLYILRVYVNMSIVLLPRIKFMCIKLYTQSIIGLTDIIH